MDCREFERQFKAREIRMEPLTPMGLACGRCYATGFLWADIDGIAAWVYCRCKRGKELHTSLFWALPLYDYEMERLFKLKPFPVQAFIPSVFNSFKEGLNNKMALFKKDLKLSEKFWAQK